MSNDLKQVLIDEGFSRHFLFTAVGRSIEIRKAIMFNIGTTPWYRCPQCTDYYVRASELPDPVLSQTGADFRAHENSAHKSGFCSRKCAEAMAGEGDTNMLLVAARIALRPDFYQSQEWRKVRYEALKIHGNKCQCCGAKPPAEIHVDHIKPRITHPYLALEITNLQVLCKDCNFGKGWQDDTDWRKTGS